MNWQFAVAIVILLTVANILFHRQYALKSKAPPAFVTAAAYLLGVMPVGITVGLLILPHGINWNYQLIALLAICGVSMALANWMDFKATKLIPVAPYQTIRKFTTIMVVFLGWVVLDEALSLNQSIGATILLAAAIIAVYAPSRQTESKKHIEYSAVLLALAAATCMAFGLVSEKAMLDHMQVGAILIVGWGTQTLAMVLLALKDASKANLARFDREEIKWSSIMGLINGTTGAFYVYAIYRSDNISLVTTLLTISFPLTVLGAHLILKERDNSLLLWVSVALSFIGLLIMAL